MHLGSNKKFSIDAVGDRFAKRKRNSFRVKTKIRCAYARRASDFESWVLFETPQRHRGYRVHREVATIAKHAQDARIVVANGDEAELRMWKWLRVMRVARELKTTRCATGDAVWAGADKTISHPGPSILGTNDWNFEVRQKCRMRCIEHEADGLRVDRGDLFDSSVCSRITTSELLRDDPFERRDHVLRVEC